MRPLFHALREAEMTFLQAWERTWQLIQPLRGQSLTVELVFDQQPGVALTPILKELHQIVRAGAPTPRLLGSRRGSYVEILSIPVSTLLALTVSLGMLVRIVDQLIVLRVKAKILTAPQVPAAMYKRALAAPASLPGELANEVRLLSQALASGRAPLMTHSADAIAGQLREVGVFTESDENAPALLTDG